MYSLSKNYVSKLLFILHMLSVFLALISIYSLIWLILSISTFFFLQSYTWLFKFYELFPH
jgi:hypothetical protein